MDLDTAQRISLIQRNLEMAQTVIDNAVELLRIVLMDPSNALLPVANAPAPGVLGSSVPVVKKYKKPGPSTRKKLAAAKQEVAIKQEAAAIRQETPLNSVIIKEFIARHNGEFKAADVVAWAQQHGYAVDDTRFRAAIHTAANTRKVITAVGKGVYKRVAA